MRLQTIALEENVLLLTGNTLTIEDVVKVARENLIVRLGDEAEERIKNSRASVDRIVSDGGVVYGITTGFGSLSGVTISKERAEELQTNLIISHAVGVGRPLSEEVVRAIMLLRINTLAKGFSGVRLSTVQVLVDMLNKGVYPHVPEKGSVGSSGDLAPLSHVILVLLGMGEAYVDGNRVTGAKAMKQAKISPIRLSSKEGLALNNGTPVMTAIAALIVYDAENIMRHAMLSSAMCFDALCANSSPLFEKVHLARPHKGQIRVAEAIRNLLVGSQLVDSCEEKVQDAYSIRATPVVLGASLDALNYVKDKVLVEINSATDNPLIFDGTAYSAANFHGQHIALAMDFIGIAMSEVASLSERRLARLLDSNLNDGLPAFLVQDSGLNSGFMITQYTAAALVSENKVLAHPSSVDSIPTCANQEDHVSMGTFGARKAREILENVTNVLAIEMMAAAQAVELRGAMPSRSVQGVVSEIRKQVTHLDKDRVLYGDIGAIVDMIKQRVILEKLNMRIGLMANVV